jgi:hypothetical protein
LSINSRYFWPVIPAKAGIQKRTLRRNAPQFFDWPPFWREKTHWIPAFAGMTSKNNVFWKGLASSFKKIAETPAFNRAISGIRNQRSGINTDRF